jgi:glycosyltransferase involved in cell wall biosynthesis
LTAVEPDVTAACRHVVYVSYDGLEDPLGQSQVRPYLERLAARGHRIDVVSFEKHGVPVRWRQPLGSALKWTALRYHRRPTVASTMFDMVQGGAATAAIGAVFRSDLIHVRSYVAATLALPWVIASRAPFLFDTRGMWPEEKVDAGAWSSGGTLYRSTKSIERLLFRRADVITVLTHAVQTYLRDEYPYRHEIRAPIHVIPTCTDLVRFSPDTPADRALGNRLGGARVLVYAGSLGTWYLGPEMARFYLAWRRAIRAEHAGQSTRFLLVSQNDPAAVRQTLTEAGAGDELVHHHGRHSDVPSALRCAEVALSFARRTASGRGTAPTKLGEALACGLPVVANADGDVSEVLNPSGGAEVGVVVTDMSDSGLSRAAAAVLAITARAETRGAARRVAERWFSLDAGVDAYDRLYRSISVERRHARQLRDATWPAGS